MKKRLSYIIGFIVAVACIMLIVAVPTFALDSEPAVALSADYGEQWVEYDTVAEMLYDATEDDYADADTLYVKLLRDITLTEPLVFSKGNFCFYFNGFTLSADSNLTDGALVTVTGEAYVYLDGIYDYYESDYTGGINADGLTALCIGGEYEGEVSDSPILEIYGCEISGDCALMLDEIQYGNTYVRVLDGVKLTSTAGPAIINADACDPAALPTLNLGGCELISADGYPAADVSAQICVTQDMLSETVIKTATFPNVLENMYGYSYVSYIAAEPISFSGNVLPYGYYVSTGEGDSEKQLEWYSAEELSLSAGDEFFIGCLDDYYYIDVINYAADNVERILPDDTETYFTERAGESVSFRVFPSADNPADTLVFTLVDSQEGKVSFTSEITEYEGSEVIEVTFEMPNDNVYFSVDVYVLHTITKIDCELGGNFEIDRTEAAAGDTVTVTLVPDANYAMSDIYMLLEDYKTSLNAVAQFSFTDTDCSEVAVPLTYTFEMPDESISVGVDYVEGCYVYYRAPETDAWSQVAMLIYRYRDTSDMHYKVANMKQVEVDGETLYKYLLPAEARSFFFQNYMTGMPSDRIPGGPTYSDWNEPQANRVYEFTVAESNPYEDIDGGNDDGEGDDAQGGNDGDDGTQDGTGSNGSNDGTQDETGINGGTQDGTGSNGSNDGTQDETGINGGTQEDGVADGENGAQGGTDGAEIDTDKASPEVVTIWTVIVIIICVILLAYLILKDGNYEDLMNIFRG